ncbi:four helix bundle protein [Microscilla marina]|uniref:S23 ribosomal n=1 Tax=Microscilla marina ATCC 23134 TaxID=313606 RepID=A1ZYB8_MICM2|nr:four helix bundle protein [Microscilla marina]EAY24591.1 S23 ribosomal [Microscilla marina ATCC 23134]
MDFTVKVYLLMQHLPVDERFALKSQIQRAAVSIPSNVAEGCSRSSQLELKRFLEIALGSSYEIETQLLLVERLKMLSEPIALLDDIVEIQKMLVGLIKSIKSKL